MADHKAPDLYTAPRHMDAHGNALNEPYTLTADAVATDKLYFGIIPAGAKVTSVRTINEATAATVTLDLGFEPVNDLGPTADNDYWLDAADIAAAGTDQSAAFPILFEHPVYLVGTVNTAAFGAAKRIDVIVEGQAVGTK